MDRNRYSSCNMRHGHIAIGSRPSGRTDRLADDGGGIWASLLRLFSRVFKKLPPRSGGRRGAGRRRAAPAAQRSGAWRRAAPPQAGVPGRVSKDAFWRVPCSRIFAKGLFFGSFSTVKSPILALFKPRSRPAIEIGLTVAFTIRARRLKCI